MRALFLDRDGTINIDYHYIRDPELVQLFPGVVEAIRRANNAGLYVAVVTNQSGINRGLIKPAELDAVHGRLQEILQSGGAKIDSFEICIHSPSENCACRKPHPKMILDLAKRKGIDLSQSLMVGDRLIDVAAGKGAGTKAALVRTGNGQEEELLLKLTREKNPALETPDFVGDDLAAVVEWFL